MSEDLSSQILENAQGPKRVRGDEGEVEGQSLADQIAADKYLASKTASTAGASSLFGMRFAKLVPPGTG